MNQDKLEAGESSFTDGTSSPSDHLRMTIHDVWGRPTHAQKLRLRFNCEEPPFVRLSPEEDQELTRLWHEQNS